MEYSLCYHFFSYRCTSKDIEKSRNTAIDVPGFCYVLYNIALYFTPSSSKA